MRQMLKLLMESSGDEAMGEEGERSLLPPPTSRQQCDVL
jgi:hypothetical protein